MITLLVAIGLLAVGTFAFRVAGPALRSRWTVSPRAETLMATAAVTLLLASAAIATVLDGTSPAGIARPAGVLVGGVLAWRKAPFVLVVIAAAATAAGLRLLGVP